MGQICKYLFRICAFRICAQGLQDNNILQFLKLLLGTRYGTNHIPIELQNYFQKFSLSGSSHPVGIKGEYSELWTL
jgi:hypothetical protein